MTDIIQQITINLKASGSNLELSINGDSIDTANEILKRIAYFDSMTSEIKEIVDSVKESEQEKFIIFASSELKRINEKSLNISQKYADSFLSKLKQEQTKTKS